MTLELRPYQQQADAWLEAHPRSILADRYGLGKTPTITPIIARHTPALVVAPDYLTYQWYEHLCATTTASIVLPEGTRAKREQALAQPADIRIVSLEMLRSYTMPNVKTVVIDEAHHIRNPKAIQSRRARALCATTNRVHFLTATPFYKEDHDIWHLLHCLHPDTFSSYWGFVREWFTVNWYAPYAPKIYGVKKDKLQAWDDMMRAHMLMRTYDDAGRYLPPLIEKTLTFELPSDLRKAYTALRTNWQLLGTPIESVGEVYYLLRQLTMCHLKVDTVRAILDTIPKEPVFIYTQYIESAHTLAGKLRTKDMHPLLLTGATPAQTRAETLKRHAHTREPRVIIATMDALNEGVNLQHIRHVIFAEETYTRGKHAQILARFQRDRNDQDTAPSPVLAYYVRARKTVDERVPVLRMSRGAISERALAQDLSTYS